MKRNINKTNLLFSFFFFFFLTITEVFAANGTFVTNQTNVYVGSQTSVILSVANVSGNITAAGGIIGVNDSSCISIINYESMNNYMNINGNKFAYFNTTGSSISTTTALVKITIKGLKPCTGKITISSPQVTDGNGNNDAGVSTGNIYVSNPPSTNNNLSTLNVSGFNLNLGFSTNQTSYNVEVNANISSVLISATPEDNSASVSGTGTHNLNYGNNYINVTVTSAANTKKTYTINVNRFDNRNNDNNLKSLSIKDCQLTPEFSTNQTNYKVEVPYEIESLNINATPNNSKSSISIIGATGLVSEQTRNIEIIVTAENGSQKKYIIEATRKKDPNKILSKVNNLTELTPSIGILSPVFDKNILDYIIYLPYEITDIDFTTKLEDETYSKLETTGNHQLEAGKNNIFKFKITAEDESIKTYTVNVKRASDPQYQTSSNTYLKSITIKNGSSIKFNKKINLYQIKKQKGFQISYQTEDPNAIVHKIEKDKNIYLIVVSPSGEYNIYTLTEEKKDISLILGIIITIETIGIITYLILHRNTLKTSKKMKKLFNFKKK